MRSIWLRVALLSLITISLSPFRALALEAPKTGSFETTFTSRSPLSDLATLTKRLGIKENAADYDLSKETCLVFVPENYDPSKPIGLVVLLNYKHSDTLPNPVLPQLATVNAALVVPKNDAMPMIARAGLALDVAHNMQQQYKIDARRVYVFGFDRESTAERLGLNFADVFTGTFSQFFDIYRPVKASNNAVWNPKLPKPDAKSFALAKSHPFVLSSVDGGDQWERWAKSFTSDGFKHVKSMTLSLEQSHYPIYTTDWLPDVLKFMDEATAKLNPMASTDVRSTTKPSTKPSAKPATNPSKK